MDDNKKAILKLYGMILELQDRCDEIEGIDEFSHFASHTKEEIIRTLLEWGFTKEHIMEFFDEDNPLIAERNSELIDTIMGEE